jgi:hypothetical protein
MPGAISPLRSSDRERESVTGPAQSFDERKAVHETQATTLEPSMGASRKAISRPWSAPNVPWHAKWPMLAVRSGAPTLPMCASAPASIAPSRSTTRTASASRRVKVVIRQYSRRSVRRPTLRSSTTRQQEGPSDRRFNNNPRIPICLYNELQSPTVARN